ncbi:hypothetical protein ACSXC1_16890, partial (plasmid) [Clostridium perfringens]|uniref:hypothetical protein n=1 Tax=Clostridium perfringens TaxID=1502 RepID=UPI003F421226
NNTTICKVSIILLKLKPLFNIAVNINSIKVPKAKYIIQAKKHVICKQIFQYCLFPNRGIT